MSTEHDAALPEREAFKAHFKHLDLTEEPDAWGLPKFKHPHVDALWGGWMERAAIAQHRAQEWQPIETAPKDGSEVLVWREDCGVLIARYTFAGEFLTYRELEGMDDHDIWAPDWFCADFVSGSRLEGSEVPTHWQPIPAAPLNKDATA